MAATLENSHHTDTDEPTETMVEHLRETEALLARLAESQPMAGDAMPADR